VAGHTHGVSAASRSTASLMIDNIGRNMGKDVVFYQGSAADQRNGRLTSRTYYWSKDQNVMPKKFKPAPDDIIALVDVDYYINMPAFLSKHFNTTLLYTFQPDSVCKDSGEYKYTFDENNNVSYSVSGGGFYRHLVWNYTGDSIIVRRKFFGITWSHSTFLVERKFIDADHQAILLAPLIKHTGIRAWLANRQISGNELTRLKPHVGNKFLRLKTNDNDGMRTHTGYANAFTSAIVPSHVDDIIASVMRMNAKSIQVPTVKSKMGSDTTGCEILYEFHKSQITLEAEVLSTAQKYVRSYQFLTKVDDYDPEAKPSLVSFMKPIVDGAFAPDVTRGNEQRSIDKRVTGLKDDTKITPFINKIINEFVQLFCADVKLHPYDEDEVYRRQDRPQQRAILDFAANTDPVRETSTFMKREAYQKVSDPRNISTINGSDKRDYSQFIYALSDRLKEMEWYAFGKVPIELAQRVVDIATGAISHVLETDFSRMDGRVGEIARILEQAICMRIFYSQYHAQLLDLLRSQHHLRGKTRFGVEYETHWSRLSGSPETSAFNTILSAFVAFLAFRMTVDPRTRVFYTPQCAWSKLGVYGGDDGITADIDGTVYTRAAAMLGQKLTCRPVVKGEPGLKFLARQYGPAVWFGDLRCVCDFARTLSKFHTTVSMPSNISELDKLKDKSFALWLTDRDSPVVGDFVSKVVSLMPEGYVFKNLARKWMISDDPDVQYISSNEDWALQLFVEALPNFNVEEFLCWLDRCKTIEDLRHPPILCDATPLSVPSDAIVVVDHDIVLPTEIMLPEPEPEPVAPQVCAQAPSQASNSKKFRNRKKKEDRPGYRAKQSSECAPRQSRRGGVTTPGTRPPQMPQADKQ
jgi:hypothetical protein